MSLPYVPLEDGDVAGFVRIFSNDEEQPVVEVPVSAAPRAPVIVADPPALDWPEAGVERLTVTNTGEGPLRITGLGLVDDAGGVFDLGTESLPELMAPGEAAEVDVSAAPAEFATGALRILSNDPASPVVQVPLSIGEVTSECPELDWPAGSVDVDDTCVFAGLDPTWDPVVEATWRAYPSYPDSDCTYSPAVVGSMTDDDGDGDVDADDPPDLCIVTIPEDVSTDGWAGVVRLLNSDGTREHWSAKSWTAEGRLWMAARTSVCALGDVDGDGDPEVVVPVTAFSSASASSRGTGSAVVALEADGSLLWLSVTRPAGSGIWWGMSAPAVADLDGDGAAEVVVGPTVLDGATGAVLGQGDGAVGGGAFFSWLSYELSFPMDLDDDGLMEIVAGPALYAPDGSTICEGDTPDGAPAAADLDGDGLGEVVISSDQMLAVMEHDCTVTREWTLPDGGLGGAPTLADFDGDGTPEIGIASKYFYYVFEADGSVLWTFPILDESSSRTGSSVFDFDGDGVSEVVFADEYNLYVVDGPTGRARFLWTGHANFTASEYPTVADVDGDGSAEVVVVHGGSYQRSAGPTQESGVGLTVIGSASSGWMPARPVWSQYAWSMTHIADDLSIDPDPSPNWPDLNHFRSADTVGGTTDLDRNARPALLDVCNLDCDEGWQRIVVQVENPGSAPLPAGIVVELRSDILGEEVAVARGVVEAELPSGGTSAGLVFDVETSFLSSGTVRVVVDPEDVVKECDEDDNDLVLRSGLCP